MKLSDLMSLLLGVLGILVTIGLYLKENNKISVSSNFYDYRFLEEKRTIKKLKRHRKIATYILFIIEIVFFCASIFIHNELYNLDLKYIFNLILLIMLLMSLVQIIIVIFIAYKNFKKLEEKIEKREIKYEAFTQYADKILFIYYSISIVVGIFMVLNNLEIKFYFIAIFVFGISIEINLYTFFYTYLNLRLQFFVNSIYIKISNSNIIYTDIINYEIINNIITFLVNENDKINRYYLSFENIEYIKKELDYKKNLLNTYYKGWEIPYKKE